MDLLEVTPTTLHDYNSTEEKKSFKKINFAIWKNIRHAWVGPTREATIEFSIPEKLFIRLGPLHQMWTVG